MSLEQIALRCKTGDRLAQRELYDALAGRMLAVLVRFVGDRARAEDILHDGFMTLFDKIDMYRGEGSFEGWVRKLFVRLALSELRGSNRWGKMGAQDELERLPSAEVSVMDQANYDHLVECIDRLADKERTVLLLYSVEGYTHEEIAVQLDMTPANSRIILHRAKGHLMLMLK